LACQKVLKINDVICKLDAQLLIEINSSPMMKSKWLFDIGEGLTYMSTQQFRLISKDKRLTKLNLNQREERGASGTSLIPDGDYLFLMQWTTKTVIKPVKVFKKLTSPFILGIDTIYNLGIKYLSKTKSFMFQENLNPEKFQEAYLRVICAMIIPAHMESQ
jgi:hypothetical protein